MITILDVYGPEDAQQDDSREAITAIARRDSQSRLNAAYAEFGKMSDPLEVRALSRTSPSNTGNRR